MAKLAALANVKFEEPPDLESRSWCKIHTVGYQL